MCAYAGDRPEYLAEAIDSICAQSYKPVDLQLFVDGPVGDALYAVLGRYSAESGVYVHASDTNRGMLACLNELIVTLRGHYRYFARMDADDVCEPDRISKQVAFLEQHPDVDIVGSAIRDIDETGVVLKDVDYPECHAEIVKRFRKRNPMAHVTVMFRERFFDKAGLYPVEDGVLGDGVYWSLALQAGCRFANLPDRLVRVRQAGSLLTRRSVVGDGGNLQALKARLRAFQWSLTELKTKWRINRRLKLGPGSYAYALGMVAVRNAPARIQRVLYARLR